MLHRTSFFLLSICMFTSIAAGTALAETVFQKFTQQMVAGKTMVSSGYPVGSMTFNTDGSMTCTNYPTFVSCKSWQIQSDGTLLRNFIDSHGKEAVEVKAVWSLLKTSNNVLDVKQSSNNSESTTIITVTVL